MITRPAERTFVRQRKILLPNSCHYLASDSSIIFYLYNKYNKCHHQKNCYSKHNVLLCNLRNICYTVLQNRSDLKPVIPITVSRLFLSSINFLHLSHLVNLYLTIKSTTSLFPYSTDLKPYNHRSIVLHNSTGCCLHRLSLSVVCWSCEVGQH